MKSETAIRAYFATWLESATDPATRPTARIYEAGLAMGYLQALATVLDDKAAKDAARAAVRGFAEPEVDEDMGECAGCLALVGEPHATWCPEAGLATRRDERLEDVDVEELMRRAA